MVVRSFSVCALSIFLSCAAADTTFAQAAANDRGGLPAVPTTKVLAIGKLTAKATPVEMRTTMPQEVRDTVRLYLAGKIDSWYVRQDQPGVVFLMMSATKPKRTIFWKSCRSASAA